MLISQCHGISYATFSLVQFITHGKDIKNTYFILLEILIDFERFLDPGNQVTQTNNKRNNAIKGHVFHIHHILNELCAS